MENPPAAKKVLQSVSREESQSELKSKPRKQEEQREKQVQEVPAEATKAAAGQTAADRLQVWGDGGELGVEDEGFKPLSREEAEKLVAANPSASPWIVVGYQMVTGVLAALLAWALTGQIRMAWSTGYGALAVVIPAAVFARGLTRQRKVAHGGAALAGFFVWELVKIVLTVVMLFAAPGLIAELSWLALVAGFVLTMKVYWVAMWFRLAPKPSVKKNLN